MNASGSSTVPVRPVGLRRCQRRMSGTVTSPEPYQPATLTINLLRTQGLAAQWEAQRQALSVIGEVTVTPDASTLPNYLVINSSIQTVENLAFAGEDAGYVVRVQGYILINNDLWALV